MGLFTKSPEKALAADLNKFRIRRDEIARQLSDAEAAIIARQSNAERLAIDGAADDGLAKAEAAISDAERHERTLIGALAQLEEQIADMEAKLAAITEAKERKQTAAEIETISADLAAVGAQLVDIGNSLAGVCTRVALVHPDGMGLRVLGERLTAEIPDVVAMVIDGLRAHKNMVLAGNAPATLRAPEASPAPTLPAPPTIKVFTIKPIRWQDQGNAAFTRHHPGFSQVDLPPPLAERAIALSAAVPVNDPRVGALSRGRAPVHAPLEDCINLDGDDQIEPAAEPEQHHEEPIKHSAFGKGRDFLDV
jgi:hypothetical protein